LACFDGVGGAIISGRNDPDDASRINTTYLEKVSKRKLAMHSLAY
jgi:hypothetical protein